MRKSKIAVFGGLALTVLAAAAHADTYDIGSTGLTATVSGTIPTETLTVTGSGANGTVTDNGVTSPGTPSGTFSFQGTITAAGTIDVTSFIDDSTPNPPTAAFPDFSIDAPFVTSYMVMGNETDIFFPAIYGAGSELRLEDFKLGTSTSPDSSVSADFTYATPLPASASSAMFLLGGLGLLRLRRSLSKAIV